ncbi:ABC transporter ATP-binding protein [Pikeienuella sp. HZG-20]|uniref:ABC transporter ATP-binding protein n=1 Tax=Paludibacillus litoralis TaxID=3133267 RepID=UPI0030EE3921
MNDAVLELEGLEVFYGRSQILFGLDLTLRRGRTLALLGRNGAGKSTTMKGIAGVAPPAKGVVRIMGREMQGAAPHVIARAGVGYVPEDRQVFPFHTVEENLLLGVKPGANGETSWTLERIYETFHLLARLKGRQGGLLSGGEQQLLTIARTLMGNPDILLLDEPSEGLAPIIVQEIGKLIRQLRETGVTILLAEQNMHFCLGLAEDAAVIDKGRIVYTGTIDELRENTAVTDQYLSI